MNEVIYFLGMRLEFWTLFLAIIAIVFTGLKDFIIPAIFRPNLKISYFPKEPYKRAGIVIHPGSNLGAFDRFKIENIGSNTAKNCRCQIYSIKNKESKEIDLRGFPLRWASRPDSAESFTKAERLNIGPGESEFVDLAHMRSDDTTKIFFNSYHNIPSGMANNIPIGENTIKIIVSGDNFKPYFANFKIFEELDLGGFHIKLLGVKRK